MDIKDLYFDAKRSSEGTWVSDLPEMGDLRLKVRGLRCPEYRNRLEMELRRVPRKHRDNANEVLFEERLRITSKLVHEVLLLDWDGLSNEGKPVPYNAKLAEKWCTDPNYRRFADAVVYAASVADNMASDVAQEAVGN